MTIGREAARSSSHYSVLGVLPNSSPAQIRSAYRKLALQWHPDRFCSRDKAVADLAKVKFQEIQEAYHVLSDHERRELYDLGLYDSAEGDEETSGLNSFVREMAAMMAEVKSEHQEQQNQSFEDLQRLFMDMFSTDLHMWGLDFPSFQANPLEKKRRWEGKVQQQRVSTNLQKCVRLGLSNDSLQSESGCSKLKKRRNFSTKALSDL